MVRAFLRPRGQRHPGRLASPSCGSGGQSLGRPAQGEPNIGALLFSSPSALGRSIRSSSLRSPAATRGSGTGVVLEGTHLDRSQQTEVARRAQSRAGSRSGASMIQKPGPGIAPEVAAGSCAWRRRRCAVVLQTGRTTASASGSPSPVAGRHPCEPSNARVRCDRPWRQPWCTWRDRPEGRPPERPVPVAPRRVKRNGAGGLAPRPSATSTRRSAS